MNQSHMANEQTRQASNKKKQENYLKERERYLRKTNHIFGENIFSYLTFMWITPLVSLGYSRPLDQKIIPNLKQKDKSRIQFLKFRQIFYIKNQGKNTYNKLLLKSLISLYKRQFLIFILLCISLVAAQMYNSIFSAEIIDYIGQQNSRSTQQNIKYFFIFVALNFVIVLLHIYIEDGSLLRSLSFMSILNLMIYDKVLKYPLISNKDFKVSEILNYSQIDVQRFQQAGYYLKESLRSFLLFITGITLLLVYIKISFLIGVSVLVLFGILSYSLLRVIANSNQKLLSCADERIKVAEQILQIIKYIKVNVLEEYFLEKIMEKRTQELKMKKKISIAHALNKITHCLSPSFVIFFTLFSYVSLEGSMTAGKAFFLIIIFKNIQFCLQRLPQCLNQLIHFYMSLKRIQNFLLAIEIKKQNVLKNNDENYAVVIEDGNFLWQKDIEYQKDKKIISQNEQNPESQKKIMISAESLETQQCFQQNAKVNKQLQQLFPQVQHNNKKYFRVLSRINLKFPRNLTTMIIGDIGSGKSSILHAILNEMIIQPNTNPRVTVNGSIAYCSQKAWILSGTIKQNILFYRDYDEERFNQAIHYACLEEDLKIIPNGVDSMIGEKGINLSGGQKVRVSLARALYADKDIYLLDDVLSAVDVHVGRFLMEKTIKGFLRSKTVIMSTHAVKFLDKSDNIVVMKKGRIELCGSYEAIKNLDYFKKIIEQQQQQKIKQVHNQQQMIRKGQKELLINNKNDQNLDMSKNLKDQCQSKAKDLAEQLIIPEQKESGEVSSQVYYQYIRLNGGKIFVLTFLFLMSAWTTFLLLSNLQISKWSSDENNSKVYLYFYLGYAIISSIFIGINFIYIAYCQVRVGSIFYRALMRGILYADLNQFFSRVPMGRILNRLSKDVAELDDITSFVFSNVLTYFFSVIASLTMSTIVSTPLALIPIVVVFLLQIFLINYHIKSQRQCVRLTKIANSPVISGLAELTTGIQTIRAYNLQDQFANNYIGHVDKWKRMQFTRQSMEYWLFIRACLISLIVNYSIFAYCLFAQNQNSSKIGLLLVFISTFFDDFQNFLFWFVVFRLKMISIQRLASLTNLQPEIGYQNNKKNDNKITNQNQKGKIQFKNYSSRYRKGLPFVLKNISITISSKKKVGIVGRTGAGKSTLINCLLRFLEPVEGQLFINEKQIREIDIKELRDRITMIEQEPTLMNATFRENLDPANLYSEEDIKSVLKECNLMNMIENKGGLNSPVTNNTISVGEKQLLCICRAILKRSSIVLIDQATANVDVNNDQLIQQIIKKGFKNSTVLTIAHRLSTLEESDQILVLNEGQVVEWGDTKEQRNRPGSIYGKMCTQNDDSYLS